MAKLQDRHWMFSGSAGQARLRVLTMCEDCRVEARGDRELRPARRAAAAGAAHTDDYLRERRSESGGDEERCAGRPDANTAWSPSSRKRTSASRSAALPIICSGILVPGV